MSCPQKWLICGEMLLADFEVIGWFQPRAAPNPPNGATISIVITVIGDLHSQVVIHERPSSLVLMCHMSSSVIARTASINGTHSSSNTVTGHQGMGRDLTRLSASKASQVKAWFREKKSRRFNNHTVGGAKIIRP